MENNGLYHADRMPLSADPRKRIAQEKYLMGEELTLGDELVIGRDETVKSVDGYDLKPDCVYRAVSPELLKIYMDAGFIYGHSKDDEYMEYEKNGQRFNNNRGVDWYLGGISLRYGSVVIECPADKRFFIPAIDNGNGMAIDPTVRHMKSSGFKNPVPMSIVSVIKSPNIISNTELVQDTSQSDQMNFGSKK